MSSQTTICAKRVCANAGRMNELKLEQSTSSNSGVISATNASIPLLTLKNTVANVDHSAPVLQLQSDHHDGAAVNDQVGMITFVSRDNVGSGAKNLQEYASIVAEIADHTADNEEGKLTFNVTSGAAARAACMTITGGDTDASDSVVTIPGILTGHKFQTETVSAGVDPAPTAAESGKAFIVPTIGITTITLPAVAAGLTFKVLFSASPSGNITLDCAGGTIFQGVVIGVADAASPAVITNRNTLTFSNSTAAGDSVDILCDGVNWHVRAYVAAHGTVSFS